MFPATETKAGGGAGFGVEEVSNIFHCNGQIFGAVTGEIPQGIREDGASGLYSQVALIAFI